MDKKKIVLIAVIVSLVIILIPIILRLFIFTGSDGTFKSLPSLENGQFTTS
jgi:flagellar basal body-associated protein FliL